MRVWRTAATAVAGVGLVAVGIAIGLPWRQD